MNHATALYQAVKALEAAGQQEAADVIAGDLLPEESDYDIEVPHEQRLCTNDECTNHI